jgi:serine/threonine-protein kinase RsbW
MLETIDLRIPPRPEYISVARLTAAAVAARQAFTYDEIEDLKVAVSEACNVLMGSQRGSGDPIVLHFVEEADALNIRIETQGSGAGSRVVFPDLRSPGRRSDTAADPRALGVFLMQCLVDEVRRIDGDGGIALRLRKKQRERSNGNPSSPQ